MGSGFDFLEKSPTTVPIKSVKNSFKQRDFKNAMLKHGFELYSKE